MATGNPPHHLRHSAGGRITLSLPAVSSCTGTGWSGRISFQLTYGKHFWLSFPHRQHILFTATSRAPPVLEIPRCRYHLVANRDRPSNTNYLIKTFLARSTAASTRRLLLRCRWCIKLLSHINCLLADKQLNSCTPRWTRRSVYSSPMPTGGVPVVSQRQFCTDRSDWKPLNRSFIANEWRMSELLLFGRFLCGGDFLIYCPHNWRWLASGHWLERWKSLVCFLIHQAEEDVPTNSRML